MLHEHDYARQARELGFQTIGFYRDGAFAIDREWRHSSAVYVWVKEEDQRSMPIRVGETLGVGGRFTSYNAWLRRRKWPGERRYAREQEKARLTKLRLGPNARVVAIRVPDKKTGQAIEAGLLQLWEPALDLNFELPTSWGCARRREWSVAYDRERADKAAPQT